MWAIVPVYVRCRKCGRKIKVDAESRDDLPLLFRIRCPYCGHVDVYGPGDAWEEVYRYRCPVCGRRFYIRREPPVRVKCPYCGSVLRVLDEKRIVVEEKGRPSSTIPAATLIGALIGFVAGALRKKRPEEVVLSTLAGAVLGALAGKYIDSLEMEKEAKPVEEDK